MKRILVVEDEGKIARLVRDYLEHAGFEVVVAGDGEVALAEARRSRPDLVVLDLGLPGRDGLDVARSLRRVSNVPIVMLTARGDETDRIVGLELGADDYVVKPFSPKELVARVRAVLRRTEAAGAGGTEVLRVADVEVDLPRMRVTVGGRPVELTPTEFQLLAAMAASRVGCSPRPAPGRGPRGRLRVLRAGGRRPRQEPPQEDRTHPRPPRYLLTVHGVGYRFADA